MWNIDHVCIERRRNKSAFTGWYFEIFEENNNVWRKSDATFDDDRWVVTHMWPDVSYRKWVGRHLTFAKENRINIFCAETNEIRVELFRRRRSRKSPRDKIGLTDLLTWGDEDEMGEKFFFISSHIWRNFSRRRKMLSMIFSSSGVNPTLIPRH